MSLGDVYLKGADFELLIISGMCITWPHGIDHLRLIRQKLLHTVAVCGGDVFDYFTYDMICGQIVLFKIGFGENFINFFQEINQLTPMFLIMST